MRAINFIGVLRARRIAGSARRGKSVPQRLKPPPYYYYCDTAKAVSLSKAYRQKQRPGAKALLLYKFYPTAEAVGLIPKAKAGQRGLKSWSYLISIIILWILRCALNDGHGW